MSNNRKFTFYNDANEVINKLCESRLSRYQDNLETVLRGSDFIFGSVRLLYYKCHKISFKRVVVHILIPQTG